jgi:hypothetical protein
MKEKTMAAGLQVRAVLTSVLSLAVGLLALWVAKYRLLIEGDWLYVAMLVLPSVVYLVVAHQVGEVKVGDFAAKFANASTQSVEVTVEALNLEEMTIDDKEGSHVPRERLDALGESTRIALALTMGRKAPNGRKGYYQRTICIDYTKELQYRHPFEFVVLLDQDRRLSGYMRYPQMLQLFGERRGWRILRELHQRRRPEVSPVLFSSYKENDFRQNDKCTRTALHGR